MNHRFFRSVQSYLAILDFLSVNAVFFTIEYLFRREGLIGFEAEYTQLGIFLGIVWLCVTLSMNVYTKKYVISFEHFTRVSMRAYIYFLLAMIVYLFFFRMVALSRIFVVVVISSLPIALLINRFIYLYFYQYFRRKYWSSSKVIVIGYNDLSKKLVEYLEEDDKNKEIIGFCEEDENVRELSHYPILSTISNASKVCLEHGVTEIYSTIAPEHDQSIYRLIQHADENCIRFKIVPDLGFFVKRQMHIDYLKEIPVIMLRNEPLEDLNNRIKKRIFDVIVSFLVIVFILSWLIPLIGLLIWLESKGPVFFSQQRTGQGNRNFGCLKFRSMVPNNVANQQQATRDDKRITRIGRFLRGTSLDELPQFLNVFQGQMSIIGPRPHMLKHTDEYSRQIGQYMVRQFMKPGITGWAQVKGFRGETRNLEQMQQRVEHDLWYMENWSLMLDLKIVFMTILLIMKGDKNAF